MRDLKNGVRWLSDVRIFRLFWVRLVKAKSLSLPATRPKMTSVELVSRWTPDTEFVS
jgi:hypothetical protein